MDDYERYRSMLYALGVQSVASKMMSSVEVVLYGSASIPSESRSYIIAMTAQAMDSNREECFQAGMRDYAQKPIEMESFAAALKRRENRPASLSFS